MAEGGEARWEPPLKVPVIELDPLSDDPEELIQKRDASEAESESGEDEQWEDSLWSLYEDALLGEESDGLVLGSKFYLAGLLYSLTDVWAGEGACTLAETQLYRKRLRLVGAERFLDETVNARVITAEKLCTAFGIRTPGFLEGATDEAFHSLLNLGICRELSKRAKLPQYNSIDDAVSLLKRSRKIIVLTGAGVCIQAASPKI